MCLFYQKITDECKYLSKLCKIWSTRWVPNGYGYPPGMGTGKTTRVWVWVEFFTHDNTGMGMVLVYLPHTLPIATLIYNQPMP